MLLFVALCYVLPCIVFPAVFLTAFKAPDIIACEASSPPLCHPWWSICIFKI